MTNLNAVASTLYATVRESTSTPKEAVLALTMVIYFIWKESPGEYRSIAEFSTELANSLVELAEMNEVKGNA